MKLSSDVFFSVQGMGTGRNRHEKRWKEVNSYSFSSGIWREGKRYKQQNKLLCSLKMSIHARDTGRQGFTQE